MRHTLKKDEIVRGRERFREIFNRGKRYKGHLLQAAVLTEPTLNGKKPPVTVGFAVRSSLKRAVDRNRMKRLMRESYRLNKHLLFASADGPHGQSEIVFLYPFGHSPAHAPLPPFAEVESDVKKILTAIAPTL